MFRPAIAATLGGLLFLGACSGGKRVPAVGPGYEIVVLSSDETRSLAVAVSEILSREVRVVRYEPIFVTVDADMRDLSFYKTRKLLFAIGTPEDEEFQDVVGRSTGTRTRTAFPGLWIDHEPFAAGQLMFLLSGSKGAISEALTMRQEELVRVVEDAAVTLLVTNLFRAGEQTGARAAMRDRWGWGVRLPPEWVVDDRFAAESFVRVWRDAPALQLFVSWEKGEVDRTPEEWLRRRDDLVHRFYEGDEVVFDLSLTSDGPTPFGPQGVFLKGLWENDRYVIGGPFRSWAFHCPEDDRTYLVDYSVYAPDRAKLPLLRVLKAVGRTFRCGCASSAPGGPAS